MCIFMMNKICFYNMFETLYIIWAILLKYCIVSGIPCIFDCIESALVLLWAKGKQQIWSMENGNGSTISCLKENKLYCKIVVA